MGKFHVHYVGRLLSFWKLSSFEVCCVNLLKYSTIFLALDIAMLVPGGILLSEQNMYSIVDQYSIQWGIHHTWSLMLTIKSQHSIAIQIMISTICMLHAIVMQVLSKKNSPILPVVSVIPITRLHCVVYPANTCNCHYIWPHQKWCHKILVVNNDAMQGPVLDAMKSRCGVHCIIATRPMVGGPKSSSSSQTNFHFCCPLSKRPKTKDLFSYFVWCHIWDFVCVLMKRSKQTV